MTLADPTSHASLNTLKILPFDPTSHRGKRIHDKILSDTGLDLENNCVLCRILATILSYFRIGILLYNMTLSYFFYLPCLLQEESFM